MHTFHTLWEDQVQREDRKKATVDWSARGRLQAVLDGRRHLGQQIMQVVLPSGYTMQQAQQAFATRLPDLIEVRAAPRSE